MSNNPFDEMIEDSKKREKENIKNITLERAIEMANKIADMAIYNYVPNNKNEMVLKGKPTYILGDKGRTAIKTVLQALEDNKNKEEKAMKILKENSIGRYKKEENGEITHIIAVEDFKKILHLIERQQEQINELKTNSISKKKIEDKIKDTQKDLKNADQYNIYGESDIIVSEIEVLQELLEES